MAYTDFGQLYPSEAGFKTPGMYGAFLQAEGAKKADYLSQMDQFFANLAESTRQFNETLGFKNKELASRETLTREGYDLQREIQTEQLDYNRWMIEQTTKSNEKIANMRTQQPNYLGGPTSNEIWAAMQKNKAIPTRAGTIEPRFQTVDYSSGTGMLRAAGAGELYPQVSTSEPYVSNYGQGGSGVSDYETYKDLEY